MGRGPPDSRPPRPLRQGAREPLASQSRTAPHAPATSAAAPPGVRQSRPRARHSRVLGLHVAERPPGAARGREGAAGRAPPSLVPLPRPAGHSRIFTRRWSRRAAAACRASRRRCSAAVRRPSTAAWPSSSQKMSPAQRDRSASCASRRTRTCELTCSSERKSGAPAAPAASGRRSRAGSTVLWWKGMARAGGGGSDRPGASAALNPPPVGAGRESASNTKKSPGQRRGAAGKPGGSCPLRRGEAGGKDGPTDARAGGRAPEEPAAARGAAGKG